MKVAIIFTVLAILLSSFSIAEEFWQQTNGPKYEYDFVRSLAINESGHIFAGTEYGVYWSVVSTAVEEINTELPLSYELSQNYPNPFNPITMITYQLPMTSEVELSVYNLIGQKVATLVSEKQQAGQYQVKWDASGFASGVYFYQLRTNKGFIQTKKLILLR